MSAKRILTSLVIIALFLLGRESHANDEINEELEYLLKAKVIHTISLFISWPTLEPSDIFSICVLGENRKIYDALKLIYQRVPTFNNKNVMLRAANIKEIEKCNIVFISKLPQPQLKETLKQLTQYSLLICADSEGYGELGVHVNLFLEQNKIRFEVNLDASKEAGIGFSSQLLRLAKIVKTKKHTLPNKKGLHQ